MKKSASLLAPCSPYEELLRPYFQTASAELTKWINTPYEHSLDHPEHLIHKSVSGYYVRSKSEALIDYALYTNKIPHRYECALHLDDILLFPDFTIRHPHTFETYYWEHFGMMDNPAYTQNVFHKLKLYADHGIIPSHNLITTYETRQKPLTSEVISQIIENFLL